MSAVASSNSNSNSFTKAVINSTSLVEGDNGGIMKNTSGDFRVDCFTNFNKETSVDAINKGLINMLYQVKHSNDIGEGIADIFKLWCHKRHAREGEKEKLLSYRYFLELYEYYPNTMIEIAGSGLFGEIGYWKDYNLIWGMINSLEMSDSDRYAKYNKLIMSFRKALLTQRTNDLKEVSKFVSPRKLGDISNEELTEMLKDGGKNSVNVSYVGKYLVREKSGENSKLFWYNDKLEIESHVSYLLRATLKKRNGKGDVVEYPVTESVPFNVKKNYRKLNSKLNVVLDVPEVLMCADRFGEMNPTRFPSQFLRRNMKGLLNEKLKVVPTMYEDESGNRHPENEGRVDLRKRLREMFRDPSKVNSGQIFPHHIAYSALKAQTTATIEGQQALWDSKIIDTLKKLEETKDKIMSEGSPVGGLKVDISKALTSGRFIGAADTSGSMTWVGKEPDRPFDIAVGLTTFLSQIAAPEYRDIALSFTTTPRIFNFKVGDRPMTLKERISDIIKYSGYSTNYKGLHRAVLELCVKNNVKSEDIPVIVVFTDGQFDSMDTELSGYTNSRLPVGTKWKTIHSEIVSMWVDSGYTTIPTIVYWNLNSDTSNVQESDDYPGVMFLQGRSVSNIKYILYGECAEEKEMDVNGVTVSTSSITPYDTFRLAMTQDYFSDLELILRESNEGLLKHYN